MKPQKPASSSRYKLPALALLLSLCASMSALAAPESIISNDPANINEWHAVMDPNSPPKWLQGEYPRPWVATTFDPASGAEFFIKTAPDGVKAFGIYNKDEKFAGQWSYNANDLKPGTYALTFRYLITGEAKGLFRPSLKGDALIIKAEGGQQEPPNYLFIEKSTEWKPFTLEFKVNSASTMGFVIQNQSQGAENVFFFTDVSLTRTGD